MSTLLSTWGWTCTAVAGQDDMLQAIGRVLFDAVLLDLSRSAGGAEYAILRIREIRPSLSERIVVISRGDDETWELVERYNLPHLLRENLLSRLWSVLEDVVASPVLGKSPPRGPQIARLLANDWRPTAAAGVRSSGACGRHFTYEHNDTIVDVLVDPLSDSNRVSLVGQILDASRRTGKGDNLAVVLSGRTGALARTTTNHLGEFNLEFEPAENVNLEIRLAERSWISIPLRHLDRLKEPMLNRATGS